MEESCLTDDAVLDFVGGRLTEPARAVVERHIGGCELCSRLVAVAAAYPDAGPANDVAPPLETAPSRPGDATGPERTASLALGTRLRETYTLVRLVGRGGMGEVYEATHARLPGRYAVKVLHPHCVADPKALVRFRREADITSELRHPNIVSIIDFDYTAGGAPYLVMEFLDGDELAHVILEEAPLPIERVLSTVDQVASALAAVHRRGIVHRDLKPQNIFLVRDPNAENDAGVPLELVKLVDFGISKVRAASMVLTGERVLLGTPQYMAPEQARGTGDVDARADQFALASIVYEMLTGRLAFPGDRVEIVVYRITHEHPRPLGAPWGPAIARVLDRAMQKDPDERFPSVADFATALRAAAVDDRPVSGKAFQAQTTLRNLPQSPSATTAATAEAPSTIPPVSVTGAVRRPTRSGAAAVALVLAIATVAIVVAARRRSPSSEPTAVAATAAPPALPPPMETPRPIEAAPVKEKLFQETPRDKPDDNPAAEKPAVEPSPAGHDRAGTASRAAKKRAASVRDSKLGSLIDRL